MKKLSFLLGLSLLCVQGYAQVIFGVNNYTQYHVGNLPIVISVPHGGLVAPASIPDRTCNNPTTVTDSRTIELARQIDTALFNLTGCRPHLVICNLKRTKVDCNRNIEDGACGNSQAETAWTEFQYFIDTAQLLVQNQYAGKAFYIDLHGHGKAIQRQELGYGLSGTNLNKSDSILNTPAYVALSSIQNLVATNVNGATHAQLLRGPNALGTLLANAGFPSVPSQQNPSPGSTAYFSGGYNTSNHTCLLLGNTVNGLQIECDSTVRSSYLNRKLFANALAPIILNYLSLHQNVNANNCSAPAGCALPTAATITGPDCFTTATTLLKANPGTTAYTFLWNTGETTRTIAAPPGTYCVTVTHTATGCTGTACVTVCKKPTVSISPVSTVTICSGECMPLKAKAGNSSTYQWLGGGPATATWTVCPTAASTVYTVVATNPSGCTATKTVTVKTVSCVNASGCAAPWSKPSIGNNDLDNEAVSDEEEAPEERTISDDLGLVHVYPSPASNELFLDYSEQLANIQTLAMYDMNGRKMCDVELTDTGYTRLDVSRFAPGLYFLKLNGTMAIRIALAR